MALVGEEQVTAQRVQALALVQLPPDSPAEFLVSDVSAEVEVPDEPGGPPEVLRMRNGPELVSQALQQFCDGKVGLSYIAGPPRSKGIVENSAATSNPIW